MCYKLIQKVVFSILKINKHYPMKLLSDEVVVVNIGEHKYVRLRLQTRKYIELLQKFS